MSWIETITRKKAPAMEISMIYILISVLGSAVGQVLLKKAMSQLGPLTLQLDQVGNLLLRLGTNPLIILGLLIYGGATVFWLVAISRVELSYAYPFASLSYVVMLIASWQIFDENISVLRLIGCLIIGMGVYLISRS